MKKQNNTGFTLTELLIVIAIIAILAVLAAPSFQDTLRTQRVEGAAEALLAALQNAKAEAIKRNSTVRIAFSPDTTDTEHSTWCFGMVIVPNPDTTPATTCDCTTANSCMTGSVVKSTDYPGVTATFNTASYRTFNPLRGTASNGTVIFSAGNNKTLGVRTFQIGRVRMCKPSGTTLISYSDSGACS
jgi:type IV fimbrial biogenesis protein FimT